jgi:predicted helicase
MAKKNTRKNPTTVDDVGLMLNHCVEIAREGGCNGPHKAFEEFVNVMAAKVGLPSRSNLQKDTIGQLEQKLDIEKFRSTLDDHLGKLYTRLEIVNQAMGQCFTPMEIADFMVATTGCEKLKPGQTILDPALGTGVFLIAALKVVQPGVSQL